ncbi:hypothetical protein R80B4_00880 [Fibrobacteres bacterium R8-0-B4]
MSFFTRQGRALLMTAALFALTAATPALALKYVAVVETGIDEASGASADLTPAEVRLITAELRREAVKNLPRDKYNVITAETVQSMGGAVLEECAEENCVITLGSKIGADYIVRGIISKFKDELTLSVEIYETNDGTLMVSSDPIRSLSAKELLEKAAPVCAEMYKAFMEQQNRVTITAPTPPPTVEPEPAPPTPTVEPEPAPALPTPTVRPESTPKPLPERKPMTGVLLGYNFFPEVDVNGHEAFQLGVVHSRPISAKPLRIRYWI